MLLRIEVSTTGEAHSIELVRSSGIPLLDEAARQGVKNWRFHPATREGVAVEGDVIVPVRFSLRQGGV